MPITYSPLNDGVKALRYRRGAMPVQASSLRSTNG